MTKRCNVLLCHSQAAGYSTLCDRHKHVNRRHGHPEQTGITVQELTPYRRRVKARVQANSDNDAWSILGQRWEKIVEAARQHEAGYQAGIPFVTYERQALLELIKLGEKVAIPELIETTLALYLMQQEQPRRFKSDAAFDAQLARRVRGLTDSNTGSYWDDKSKRSKRVYRDVPPRTLATMADHLKAAFGVAGVYVARLEQREYEQVSNEKAAFAAALEKLK